jgi:hypothetical protein
VDRVEGVNWLGHTPPQVSIVLRTHRRENGPSSQEVLPGLLVWSVASCSVWLLLDEREGKGGKVYVLGESVFIIRGEDSDGVDGDEVGCDEGGEDVDDDDSNNNQGSDDGKSSDGDKNSDDDNSSDDDGDAEEHVVLSNWIEWQKHVWREIELAAAHNRGRRDWPGIDFTLIGRKAKREQLTVKAWTRRHEPGYLDWSGPIVHPEGANEWYF